MSEKIVIQSKLKPYTCEFVDDVFSILRHQPLENAFFIIDSRINDLNSTQLDFLNTERTLIVEASEPHKSYDYCGTIIQEMLNRNIRKNSTIIAIGGGIMQDISAFVSSILFRGIEWQFVPTTLLAQADSCIGGKTSINFYGIKNTLGNFNPPVAIYIDKAFLNTLPVDDIKSGIGEMLHFYYYANSQFIHALFNDYQNLLVDRSRLKPFIQESLRIKKSVIEVDEFDKGERNKFNYGHTFGHALESVTNYAIKHGQAVTVGMDIANRLSQKMGLIDLQLYTDIERQLRVNFPLFNLSSININEYIKYLSKDKKNVDDQLVCILCEGRGKMVKKKIPMDAEFKKFLSFYFEEHNYEIKK